MASITQKFVLVGPHAGRSMVVNGHEFVDGEMTFQGSADQAATLERVFEFYGAMTADKAELHALREGQKPADTKPAQASQNSTDESQGTQGSATSTEALKPAPDLQEGTPDSKPNLAEAIGTLDPENDAHWTSNNLPSLDHLSDLVGKKVARGEVDAVAEGYTRAKARAAKQ